jgi:DNA-binding winged helix-turn-helix (wHTH) protein
VTVNGEEVSLTALEFKLLVTLTERRDRVQARGTLLSDVWAIDAEIASRTVDTHVKRLRDKLGTAGRFIETVRGVGYRFSENPGRRSDGRARSVSAGRVASSWLAPWPSDFWASVFFRPGLGLGRTGLVGDLDRS